MLTTTENLHTIRQIVKRAEDYGKRYEGAKINSEQLESDLIGVMISGTRLDLDSLLHAGQASFYYDLIGITLHINRNTGELRNFCPVHLIRSNVKLTGGA